MKACSRRLTHERASAGTVAGAVLLAAFAFHARPSAQADAPVVQTANGAVRGAVKAQYSEFLGIPFAAPPVGSLRWKAPQAAANWSGVRDATAPGDRCVQGTGWDPGYESPTYTEDCLYLNVYRPNSPAPAGSLRPVFVWIHGGGLRGGAGFDVDPRKFVGRGDVLFVTLNYRLGALGFLAVPGLSREDPDAVGSYGLLDQQAALRWVRDNIRAFGGDPAQVTIAGQSAGASSVCNQLASPSVRGLFVRAVHQSGGCSMTSRSTAEATGAKFAEAVGCGGATDPVACLRSKSAADVLAAQTAVPVSSAVFGGAHFPVNPADAVRAGEFARVPVVIGQTRDERTQSMFASRDHVGRPVTAAQYTEEIRKTYGAHADAVLARYPVTASWSPTVALATVEGDERSCVRQALIGQFAGAVPTFAYEFDEQDPPPFVSIWRLNTTFRFGATHVNELGYLFDYLRQALPFSSAQGELSDQMISYWTAFTRTGDPNGATLPKWPRYAATGGPMMSLKASGSHAKSDFAVTHQCSFWASIEN